MTERQSRKLAARIANYWAERGYSIALTVATTDRIEKLGSSPYWHIRSDMVNGYPKDYDPRRAAA